MQPEIRPVSSEEFETFTRATETAFGVHAESEDIERERLVFEPKRSLAVFDSGRIVGTAGAFSLTLTVPGGQLPMPGVTVVGVHPTHRRQGILTSMMRRQLDDFRDQGEIIAGLWASEGAIYGRFGYGAATFATSLRIRRNNTSFVSYERTGRTSLLDKDSARKLFPSIYERVASRYPGTVSRPGEWWRYLTTESKHWSGGFSPMFFGIYESSKGEAEGYVIYRIKHDWPNDPGEATLRVTELIADTAEAYAALWRLCFDHDLIDNIEAWPRQADEPLLHLLSNPRELNLRYTDGMWLRFIDLPRALAARTYAAGGEVVFQVRDSFCPWNEGRFELVANAGRTECRPVDRPPDLTLDSRDLVATYLGGVRFQTLARAGRVEENVQGALARADRLFSWDPPPWCAHVF